MWARIAHNLRTSPTGKAVLQTDKLDAVTDRGYFRSRGDHRDAAQADDLGRAKLEGRFCKQDFVYLREEEVHRCSACERLTFHYVNEEKRAEAARYWTNACGTCAISTAARRARSVASPAGRVQRRLDDPQAMRQRRETVEHPFGTLKVRMGATHFLMKRLPDSGDHARRLPRLMAGATPWGSVWGNDLAIPSSALCRRGPNNNLAFRFAKCGCHISTES